MYFNTQMSSSKISYMIHDSMKQENVIKDKQHFISTENTDQLHIDL